MGKLNQPINQVKDRIKLIINPSLAEEQLVHTEPYFIMKNGIVEYDGVFALLITPNEKSSTNNEVIISNSKLEVISSTRNDNMIVFDGEPEFIAKQGVFDWVLLCKLKVVKNNINPTPDLTVRPIIKVNEVICKKSDECDVTIEGLIRQKDNDSLIETVTSGDQICKFRWRF